MVACLARVRSANRALSARATRLAPPLPAVPQAGPVWDASSHGAGRRTSRRLRPGYARDVIGRRPGGPAGRRGWHLRRRRAHGHGRRSRCRAARRVRPRACPPPDREGGRPGDVSRRRRARFRRHGPCAERTRPRGALRWRGPKRGDQPQQGVPADRNLEGVRHPGAGPARERKTDRHQRRPQPLSPSPEPAGETGYLLGEGHALAGFLLADEPPYPQRHHDELARHRKITRKSQVGAVYSPRPAPAPRTGRPPCGRTGLDPDDRVDHLDRFHQHTLDRGELQLVQLRQRFVHGEGLSTTPPSSQAIFGRTSVVLGGQCAHDWLAAHEPGSTHQAPLESII